MFIQGERLDCLLIEEIITAIFGESMHAKHQFSLANAALGVISSASSASYRNGLSKSARLIG